jgi:eukaryotic-like serine/threonine-protein kinase
MAVNRPTKIGKYNILDVIGRGGMGIVYKGTDPYLDRLVAIKMMTGSFADNPDLLKRFFREAQSTASLQHPNIVTVYELGDHSGNPYLVMEYLDGESLDSVISTRRQLSTVEKIDLMIEVCRGLSYAHHRGIVHRDIKPANIMVCQGGGVKIVDFGIAHFGDKNVTRTGQIVGSISYMSPEQVNGRQVDARTDIFSTGVMLFQLFTFVLPFDGESTASTLLKIIHEPPPPLKNFLATYPPELETIIHRALAKDRNERYTSADELALDLGQLQSQLKQEMITRHLQEATRLIEKNDLYKAKGQLLQVLQIDRQHTEASHLLREIQEKIQRQEINEEIRQLRSQAEDAYAQEQFETALGCIERALTLDKENADLQQLRDTVKAAELRARRFQRAVRLAESAHQTGDLDSAKQAIEEALEIRPNDTHAKALQRAIQRDWLEHSRQRKIESYLEQARKEITSRKFTSALELLKQAEALDPAAPQIRALIESATAAKEQERRRRELEAINREIEDALNRDDYEAASAKAEKGLKSFPEERTLLKLKMLAEKQRQVAERKEFVDEQLALARTLLERGQSEELITRLEAALAKVGGEPRLQSLLLIVRENVERERLDKRKAEYLQKAKDALRHKEHEEAARILEAGHTELPDAIEIEDLLQFAREEAINEKRRRAADAAAHEAHGLMADLEYDRAIQLLEKTLQEVPDEELRIVLGEARRAAADYEKKFETALATASKLIEERKASEAVKLLEIQPASFSKRLEFQHRVEAARKEAERLYKIQEEINRSREMAEREDYSSALSLLEQCRKTHGDTPELVQQFAQIREKRSEVASTAMEKALSDARMLLNAAEYRAALDRLALLSQVSSHATPELKSQYESVKQQASNGLAYQRKLEIERHMAAGEFTGAAALLQQTLTEFPGHRDLSELEVLLHKETARRSDAQAKHNQAQQFLQRAAWNDAAEVLNEAFAAAERIPPVREAVLKAFLEGAQAAIATDWRAAELLLTKLGELQPNYPGSAQVSIKIAERRREEVVAQCLEKAKRAQAAGDLRGALSELTEGLATYADDSRLSDLDQILCGQIREEEEKAQREKERLEKEAFLRQVSQRAEQEARLEQRIQILQQALARYPGEPTLDQQLNQSRDLWKRVSEFVNEACAQEEAKHYQEALKCWQAVGSIHGQYPDLGRQLEKVKKLHDDAREASRAEWISKLEGMLASGEFEQAIGALRTAQQEFPSDRQLGSFETRIEDALKLRAKAEKLLAGAEKAFNKSQWTKGAESLERTCEAAPQDLLIRRLAIELLTHAFNSALKADWQSANSLLPTAEKIPCDSALLKTLRERVDGRKKEQIVATILSTVRSSQQSGDWQSSLRQINDGLSAYPKEPQLLRAKTEIETRLRQFEQERLRQQELEKQRELQREREIEEKRRRELQREHAKAREREQELARARELQREQDRARQREAERREAERQREQQRKEKEEKDRHEQQARLQREEAEKVRLAAEAKQRAEQKTQLERARAQELSASRDLEAPGATTSPATQSLSPETVFEPSSERTQVQETPPVKERVPWLRPQVRPLPRVWILMGGVLIIVLGGLLLWMKSSAKTAPLEITTTPVGATIRIENTDQSCVTPNCRIKLLPGQYEIEAELQGYQTTRRPISISPTGTNSVVVNLIPIPEAKQTQEAQRAPSTQKPELIENGQLEIRGAPAGAQIFVDGALKGKTSNHGSFSTDVVPGEHEIKIVARNETPSIITRQFPAGGRVELNRTDFKGAVPSRPGSELRPEESDWLQVKDSSSAEDINSFLRRYPNGVHQADAESKLDDLYWAQASQSNTVATVRDYLNRYPRGRHADDAKGAIARMDWQAVENSNDAAAVGDFLRRYPSGPYHDRAAAREDDLMWGHTARDSAGLHAYLQEFPAGRHADEARSDLESLTRAVEVKRPAEPPRLETPSLAIVDDKKAVLDVLKQYQSAYQDRKLDNLRRIWPNMSERQMRGVTEFFSSASSVTLNYELAGEPEIKGDYATVRFTQSLSYVLAGKAQKPGSAKVEIRMKRGTSNWQIDSIR